MTYVTFINDLIKQQVQKEKEIVLFGQNISAGSCISGFTRGLEVKQGSYIINTTNAESSLVGVGFGLMLNGVSSIFFMKQLDFLLLGIDQLVNTYNFIRLRKTNASFTIMPVVVDSGYEGPQSRLNNLTDFCSIADIVGFTITNETDAERIIKSEMISPGFRIIAVSQRLFKKEIIDVDAVYSSRDNTLFQYTDGTDATVVCFNFAFPQGLELCHKLKEHGIGTSLFSVNAATPIDWSRIIENVGRTRNIVIIDDSRSRNCPWNSLLTAVYRHCSIECGMVVNKQLSVDNLSPNSDRLIVDYDGVVDKLLAKKRSKSRQANCQASILSV